MKFLSKHFGQVMRSARVGLFLGLRQIARNNIWITILIIFIMTLTFMSLVVIPGILIGLTEGSFEQNRERFSGDLYLSTLPDEQSIANTQEIVQILDVLPEVENYSVRYKVAATIETGYIDRDDFTSDTDKISVNAYVIDPEKEDVLTDISSSLIEGRMLQSDKSGEVIVGTTLLKKYSQFADLFEPLENVEIGSSVKITLQGAANTGLEQERALLDGDKSPGQTSEFIVAGILDSKVSDLSTTIIITEPDYRRIAKKSSLQAAEIAIKHVDDVSDQDFKDLAIFYEFDKYAKVQTATEAIPKFLSDVQLTFGLLGNVIGMIGIVVSSITLFIIIYINAITRRKFIGILKGIGVSGHAIEFAYITQSLFYAFTGIILGSVVIYGVLVPFFASHPIDFPFSDGILVAEYGATAFRAVLLAVITILAGYVPAKLIVRQNTLDSILQR